MKNIFSYIKKTGLYLVAAIMVILVSSGCSKNDPTFIPGIEEEDDEVTLVLQIPTPETPLSRSMAGGEDYLVKEAVVLAFSVQDSPYQETLEYYREGRILSNSSGNNMYSAIFRAQLKEGNYKLVIVANPGAELKDKLSKLTDNGITDKVEILRLIQYTNTEKWAAGNIDYTPIPMYAETGVENIKVGKTLSADPILIRMLSRIDITVNLDATSEGFKLEKVYLANYNTTGYVAPIWNINGITTTNISAVNLPPVPGVNNTTMQGYEVNATSSRFVEYKGEIYTFETAKATTYLSDTEFYNSVCLILEGSFNNGANTFYRVDMTNESNNDYMPLLRNHKYDLIITHANRAGYATAEEALKSYGVTTNGTLKVRTVSYDMGDLTNIVFDEEYLLGTNAKTSVYEFTQQGGTGSFIIYTDYPEGFSLEAYDLGSGQEADWILLSMKEGTGVQTITYEVSGNNSATREANIILSAGRLSDTIQIRQSGN